jgi:hypothetical protein
MGGRATPGMSVGGGSRPAGAPPRSLRERFGALRNLPPFLELVWRTSPGLTAPDLVCRLARAFLPVTTLFVGKLIITAVLISHRFSSVRMADRILVLAEGEIEAAGTHHELLAAGGRYAELFELQAAAYRH